MENINEENTTNQNIADDTISNAPITDETTFIPPAPVAQTFQVEDRLVRDPEASFAGVLSGVAHRYGFDVALTRLAYIVLTFISAGFTIPVYLLSWIIIPRARYWPPVQRKRTRTLSGRDVGFALIGLAALIALSVGTGEAAAIIVPLGLIIGGVWMLVQSPRNETVLAGAAGGAALASSGGGAAFAGVPPVGAEAPRMPWTTPQMPDVSPERVEPRSRKRRFAVLGLIAAVLLLPVLFIGGIIVAIASSDWDVDFDQTVTDTPINVDQIPRIVDQDSGEYILDLRNTDLTSLDVDDDPLTVNVDLDAGRIEVLLPSDVAVEVDAEVDVVGEVTVFGRTDDGVTPNINVSDDDPQIILDLSVDVGEVVVIRSN